MLFICCQLYWKYFFREVKTQSFLTCLRLERRKISEGHFQQRFRFQKTSHGITYWDCLFEQETYSMQIFQNFFVYSPLETSLALAIQYQRKCHHFCEMWYWYFFGPSQIACFSLDLPVIYTLPKVYWFMSKKMCLNNQLTRTRTSMPFSLA